jgi:hypothetical protein
MALIIFQVGFSSFVQGQPWTEIFLPKAFHIAGSTGTHYHTVMGSSNILPRVPRTTILHISAANSPKPPLLKELTCDFIFSIAFLFPISLVLLLSLYFLPSVEFSFNLLLLWLLKTRVKGQDG